MATLEELVVRLEADNAKLLTALEESSKVTAKSANQMQDAISKFSESATKDTNKFGDVMTVFAGNVLANVAVKAAEMAMAAMGELFSLFKEGVAESSALDQQMVRLANSLAMSGNFTEKAMGSLTKFVDEMERYSGVDDAVIASNLSMLSSMTKLKSDGLERAQKAAIDLSAALGIDLGTATTMVAKAAEGNVSSFKKYGVTIQEAADKSLTFANTLSTIESRMGGAAGGAMRTFEGAVLGARNAFGNLFQAMGDVVVKNPAVIAVLTEIGKVLGDMTKGVSENAGSWSKTLANALSETMMIFGYVTDQVQTFVNALNTGFRTIALGAEATIASFLALGDALDGNFEKAGQRFEGTKEIWGKLSEDTTKKGSVMSDTFYKIGDAASTAAATMGSSLETTKANITSTAAAVEKLTYAQQLRIDKSVEFGKQLAEESMNVQGQYQMQQEAIDIAYAQHQGSFEEYKAAKLASQTDLFAQEDQMLQDAYARKLITDEQYRMATTQLNANHYMTQLKMAEDLRKQEEAINKAKLQGYSTFFGGMAALSQSGNAQLAGIGKAAAISQATIDAYLAIQNALANVPYPANIAAAAGIGVQAFANVAKISGVGFKKGIDNVPGVGSGDNFPAMLAPGERVVPSETNKDLTSFLDGDEDSSAKNPAPIFNLNFYGPVWGDKASAGADIVEAINEAVARGMSLRILGT